MRAGPASYADVEGRPSEYGEVAKAAAISDIIFLKYPFFLFDNDEDFGSVRSLMYVTD